ncbi:MAG: aminoglycoside phosphotransferase family protein [Candidatus Thorarchaeota archaeon]
MTDQIPTENEYAIELQNELVKEGIVPPDSKIELYSQVHGGADTTIFEIGFENQPTQYIQRILRPSTSKKSAEFEFSNQTILFENGINVPETFFIRHPPNLYNRTYYVMKKIQGRGLNEILAQHPDRFEEVTNKYIHEMTRIHSTDPKLFPKIPTPDIQKNPYDAINRSLSSVKDRIVRYSEDLVELAEVVSWLDEKKNENPCEELVVIHGDYHPYNIVVDEQQTFQILDWTGINISDFRRDLSFATVALSAGSGRNLAPLFANKYEQFTGKKVKNLEYFMILSSIWNLLRMYSGLNNPAINNEGEEILAFFKSIQYYPLLLVELAKEECGIDLKQIKKYFS